MRFQHESMNKAPCVCGDAASAITRTGRPWAVRLSIVRAASAHQITHCPACQIGSGKWSGNSAASWPLSSLAWLPVIMVKTFTRAVGKVAIDCVGRRSQARRSGLFPDHPCPSSRPIAGDTIYKLSSVEIGIKTAFEALGGEGGVNRGADRRGLLAAGCDRRDRGRRPRRATAASTPATKAGSMAVAEPAGRPDQARGRAGKAVIGGDVAQGRAPGSLIATIGGPRPSPRRPTPPGARPEPTTPDLRFRRCRRF